MEDNALGHWGVTIGYRFKNDMDTMLWPSNSPDMNLSEAIWHDMKVDLGRIVPRPTKEEDLMEFAQEQWAAVMKERMESLIREMPQRIKALIEAKGGYTRY